jgi:hypothetical protein
MEKQVPESNAAQQITELQEQLRGNKIFGSLRGNSGCATRLINQILKQSENPTDFLRHWDAKVADLRVIGNIMATLKRDGKTEALDALQHALSYGLYTFPGETVAPDKTVPMTLVMFEPEATLSMLSWITRGHWHDFWAFLGSKHYKLQDDDPRTTLVKEMFANFPSLARTANRPRISIDEQWANEGWDLLYAYQMDVLRKFKIPENFHPMLLTHGQFNDHLELNPQFHRAPRMMVAPDTEEIQPTQNFAFWVEGDQATVLSQFTREEQKCIATWQFHVHPSMTSRGLIEIGLHPESGHAALKHQYVLQASAGVSHGFGAIIDPPENYQEHRGSYGNTNILFRSENRK